MLFALLQTHVSLIVYSCQAFLQVQGAVATVIVGTVDAVLVIRLVANFAMHMSLTKLTIDPKSVYGFCTNDPRNSYSS